MTVYDGDFFNPKLAELKQLNVQLNEGTYILLINHFPLLYGSLAGTLRIEKLPRNRLMASGDLYTSCEPDLFDKWILNKNKTGIPDFHPKDYRTYLKVVELVGSESDNIPHKMTFKLYKYSENPFESLWQEIDNTFSVELFKNLTENANDRIAEYWHGMLIKHEKEPSHEPSGYNRRIVGNLTIKEISNNLRKAAIQVYMPEGVDFPLKARSPLGSLDDNSDQTMEKSLDWHGFFKRFKWQFQISLQKTDPQQWPWTTSSGEEREWSTADLHEYMLMMSENSECEYSPISRLICVPKIGDRTGAWGIMFDQTSTDSNKIPREVSAVAYAKQLRTTSDNLKSEMILADCPEAFFFVSAHEIMHTFNLTDNPKKCSHSHIMLGLNYFINRGSPSRPFPQNLSYELCDGDERELKHYPDIWVYPGGSLHKPTERFDHDQISSSDLEIFVNGDHDVVLGGPVRLDITIKNISKRKINIPRQISSHRIRYWGEVTSANSARFSRIFKKTIYELSLDDNITLNKNESYHYSVILTRGPHGCLFPKAGIYTASIYLLIMTDKHILVSNTKPSIRITSPRSERTKHLAKCILSDPDMQLLGLIGGDGFANAMSLLNEALQDNELAPYYEAIEFNRLNSPFRDRKANPLAALSALRPNSKYNLEEIDTILTAAEEVKTQVESSDFTPESIQDSSDASTSLSFSDLLNSPSNANTFATINLILQRIKTDLQHKAKPSNSESISKGIDELNIRLHNILGND